MNEDFLYYIWQFKRWQPNAQLTTQNGEEIEVLSPGQRNLQSGPDFLNAKIKIGNVLWVGNVEIHVNTSDWFLHGHEKDEAYSNLILHVVFNHNLTDVPNDIPILELKSHIPKNILQNYDSLQPAFQFIPCENLFNQVDEFTLNTFQESLVIQRLENKTEQLAARLQQLNGDLEALTFEQMAYVFGLKINAEAFQLLAKSFPYSVLKKLLGSVNDIEALLFGQAGFLENPVDEYSTLLKEKYHFVRHKYQLTPIDKSLFLFFRLRPANFPTIRLSQLAHLVSKERYLFNPLMNSKNIESIQQLIGEISASDYWDNHYTFGNETKKSFPKKVTERLIQILIVNAIIPLKFLYAKQLGKSENQLIINMLRDLPSEKNKIIEQFKHIGAPIHNAWESQAFLELKKNFCDKKNCLNCRIGHKILNLKS